MREEREKQREKREREKKRERKREREREREREKEREEEVLITNVYVITRHHLWLSVMLGEYLSSRRYVRCLSCQHRLCLRSRWQL
jgi:hypothetical protein